MKRTLLLVDDEMSILSSLRRLFAQDGYVILMANGGEEALELLAKTPAQVILTDQRMPGMTGVELLARAGALYPETVRMVLSGYSDLKAITDAINEGHAYKFLFKPWDDEELRSTVREAFEQAARLREGTLYSHLYHDTQEGVFSTDPDGVIQSANPAFVELSGYAEDALAGLPLSSLIDAVDDDAPFAQLWRGVRERGKWTGEVALRCSDGSRRPALLNVTGIRDAEGRIDRYAGALSDISEQKRRESEHVNRAMTAAAGSVWRDPVPESGGHGWIDMI